MFYSLQSEEWAAHGKRFPFYSKAERTAEQQFRNIRALLSNPKIPSFKPCFRLFTTIQFPVTTEKLFKWSA